MLSTNLDFNGEYTEVFQEKLEFSLKWDAVFSIHYMIYIQFPYDTKDVRCIISSTSLKPLETTIIKYKEQFEQDILCFNTKFTTGECGRLLAQQEFNNHFNQKYTFQHDPSKMAILADKQLHVCDLRIRYLMTYLLLRENEKKCALRTQHCPMD